MNVSISFDPLHVLGLFVCAYLSGLVGSVLGAMVALFFTPRLDGERLFKGMLLFAAMGSLTPLKLVVSFIASAAALFWCNNIQTALCWATGSTFVIAAIFMLLLEREVKV